MEMCSICNQNKATGSKAIYLTSAVTRFIVVSATVTTKYLHVRTCEQCKRKVNVAQLLRRLGFVAAGFLGVFALLGGIMIANSLSDGIAVPVSAAVSVAALVLGAVGCVVLHRLGTRKLGEYLSAVHHQG